MTRPVTYNQAVLARKECDMSKNDSTVISLRIPRNIYARLYSKKGQGQIKSLQDFIIRAIEEKLNRKEMDR